MAELRRVGGGMEPHRGPSGRRALLPAEAELCNFVGITEAEYWDFVGQAEAYNGQRPPGYQFIPDVKNDVVTVVVTLAVGLALSAVAAAIAPKPAAPKTRTTDDRRRGTNLQTESITGRQRFTPTNNFSSVQETAVLGEVIPLVYARRGVRVASRLLWSQLKSFGTGQQLSAIMLFSAGPIGGTPDFTGLAIGDTLLENYTNAKLKVYWRRDGGRILRGDAYSQGTLATDSRNDVFSIFYNGTNRYEPFFCGTRNPNTNVEFGVFNPTPNGMKYKVRYELVLELADSEDDVKKDQSTKRRKIAQDFPHRAYVRYRSGSTVIYRLDSAGENPEQFNPWGTEDVRTATESSRIQADETLTIGEQYLLGNAIGVCTGGSNTPWDIGLTKDYTFRIIEGNAGDIDGTSAGNTYAPYAVRTIQRVAIGTITNNRSCNATEIGLKSTVFKRLNGAPNMNSEPDQSVIRRYERDNANISLGQISTYVTRFSFFYLQARPIGGSSWKTINDGTVFVIKGRSPQAQYNFIRISHKFGQYEFRLHPYSGNQAYRSLINKTVYLLRSGNRNDYSSNGYTVSWEGVKFKLTPDQCSNSEWVKGPPAGPLGDVVSLNRGQDGDPSEDRWRVLATDYSYEYVPASYAFLPAYNYDCDEDCPEDCGERMWRFEWLDDFLGTSRSDIIYRDGYRYRAKDLREEIEDDDGNYRGDAYSIEKSVKLTTTPSPVKVGTASTRGGRGTGLTVSVKAYRNGAATWSINNPGIGYRTGDRVTLKLKSFYNACRDVQVTITISSKKVSNSQASINPYDAIADYWIYDSEQSSHQDGPEHSIVYCNEVIAQGKPNYQNLAIGGIQINASTEWNSFSNYSAFIKNGIQVLRLINDNGSNRSASALPQSTNLFPEIAYDLLTNGFRGAGALVGTSQVDRERMQIAAKFCRANGFYWDGAITEGLNLREFIFQMAGYNLLDFTIIGGRFSLVPAVPYNSNYTINKKGKPDIKALFTDGNVKDLKVSFLTPEERQDFKATILWREDKTNGFPRTRVITSRLNTTNSSAPEETFDLQQFCTSQAHALWFARTALLLRNKVDHSVTFETTPQAAMNLQPGEYFRLVSHTTHTSRFDNGSINDEGYISASTPVANDSSILYWKVGTEGVKTATIEVTDNRTEQTALWNSVFTINNTTTRDRVYKLESLEYSNDGLVSVTGSHVPLTSSGTIAYLDWEPSAFVEES